MKIAVAFDGTIVENRYPETGPEYPHATGVLKRLQQMGHQVILWTTREGRDLEEAVHFCKKKGLKFDAVNKDYPGEAQMTSNGSKIRADLFIDSKNLGGTLTWPEMYWMIQLQMVG